MTEDERLQIQNSTTLSIALISFSAALIAGAVAGFLAIADKIKPGVISWILVGVVTIAIISLTLSIMFGGQGISATNRSIRANPVALTAGYDKGNFGWQVICGVLGLLLGAIGFICLAVAAMTGPEESELGKTRSQIEQLGKQMEKLGAQLQVTNSQFVNILAEARSNEKLLTEILADTQLLLQRPRADKKTVARPTGPAGGHR
jgi:hypothetical protein